MGWREIQRGMLPLPHYVQVNNEFGYMSNVFSKLLISTCNISAWGGREPPPMALLRFTSPSIIPAINLVQPPKNQHNPETRCCLKLKRSSVWLLWAGHPLTSITDIYDDAGASS
jgi:hypothetical protein